MKLYVGQEVKVVRATRADGHYFLMGNMEGPRHIGKKAIITDIKLAYPDYGDIVRLKFEEDNMVYWWYADAVLPVYTTAFEQSVRDYIDAELG